MRHMCDGEGNNRFAVQDQATAEVRLDNPTLNVEPIEDTVRKGQDAWQRLQNQSTWEDHIAVGKAHVRSAVPRPCEKRAATARTVATTRPHFTVWQHKRGFENLDKADRCRLFEVMDHLPEIEAWRNALPPRSPEPARKSSCPTTVPNGN